MISFIELQKMLYLANRLGIEPKFEFQADKYGAYSKNLRFILKRIEGYYVTGYADGGDSPYKLLSLIDSDIEEKVDTLKNKYSSQLSKLEQLIAGFESPRGMEILSTVDWILCKDSSLSNSQLVSSVHNWNSHKAGFTENQILIARERLESIFVYQ